MIDSVDFAGDLDYGIVGVQIGYDDDEFTSTHHFVAISRAPEGRSS